MIAKLQTRMNPLYCHNWRLCVVTYYVGLFTDTYNTHLVKKNTLNAQHWRKDVFPLGEFTPMSYVIPISNFYYTAHINIKI